MHFTEEAPDIRMDKNKVEYSGTYLGKKKVTKADYNRIEKACRGEIKFKNITNKNIAKMK